MRGRLKSIQLGERRTAVLVLDTLGIDRRGRNARRVLAGTVFLVERQSHDGVGRRFRRRLTSREKDLLSTLAGGTD